MQSDRMFISSRFNLERASTDLSYLLVNGKKNHGLLGQELPFLMIKRRKDDFWLKGSLLVQLYKTSRMEIGSKGLVNLLSVLGIELTEEQLVEWYE